MLDDFPIIDEIKQEYRQLRVARCSRAEATQKLMETYTDEIGDADDGPLFWIGLAEAQFACKELSRETAEMGLKALDVIKNTEAGELFGSFYITKCQQRYTQQQMPERKKITERKRFQCTWQIGDVYAYRIKGEWAKKLGIAGKYMLLRKVDNIEWDKGEIHPAVTFTYWNQPELPKTAEEFQTIEPLRVACGRLGYPKDRYDYRIDILFRRRKQVDDLELLYLGNFPDVLAPKDEVVVTRAGDLLLGNPNKFDEECCLYYNNSLLVGGSIQMPIGCFSSDQYEKYIKPGFRSHNIGGDSIAATLENAKRLLKAQPDGIKDPVYLVYYDVKYRWLVEKRGSAIVDGSSTCVMLCTNGDVLSVFSCSEDLEGRWFWVPKEETPWLYKKSLWPA